MAAKGYPDDPQRGSEIRGLDAAASDPKVKIFHAGTRRDGDRLIADGGRVLGVTALGSDLAAGPRPRLRRGRPHRLARRLLPPRHRPTLRRQLPGDAPGPIQRIGFHSLLTIRPRSAKEVKLTSHIAINCGWPT